MTGILAAAEAICNTRFPPSVKLGSRVRRGPRPRPRLRPHSVDIPQWEERTIGRDEQMLRLSSAHVWELGRVFSEAWHASSA